MGAKNNDSHSEKQAIVKFYTMEYRKCGNFNSKNDSRPCMGASAFLQSVDFTAFAVNVKTIAPKKYLYQFGHAIWWGDMPMILYTFFDAYDFSGKNIVPFNTHGGSGFSNTISTIAELEPDANVIKDGFTVSRDNVQDAEADIIAWLGDLGYKELEPTENTGNKALVVYYSATGNTEEVANYIAAAKDADLFELEPAQSYSSDDLDWTDRNSRVSREHDNPQERVVPLVADTVENWDSYDTVFIGYPIWWGIAAWPVDGFIAANDFTGKTVIPFCTSSSSGLGESGELLEKAAGTGEWLEGIRFRSGASEETVVEWVNGLELQ